MIKTKNFYNYINHDEISGYAMFARAWTRTDGINCENIIENVLFSISTQIKQWLKDF